MAQLIVRDLEDDLKTRLRERARARGHSMEEEARRILRGALMQPAPTPAGGLGARIVARFHGIGLAPDEALPELRGETVRSAQFDAARIAQTAQTARDRERDTRRRRRR